ncbi:Histidinol phosphatase and related hydrolases of the PHP family [Aggregatibacter aphrophilus]|nr:Histidinol phosphatase and related hydrolases of the PHP family [Aggregatibacter aphrophilus]
MTKYDLHCHSTASDGVLSPTEVVLRAYEKGVNVLALTDHDTVAGVSEAHKQADLLGIQLINGVELSTLWENRSIHI